MKNFYLIIMLMLSVGCANGNNRWMNNANMGGLIGGTGGAVGGAMLGKNLKGGAKIAAIGGGAILGMLLGNRVGQWFDEKDQQRNRALIQKVLNENQDNEMGQISYSKSFVNPNTGQTQTGMVTQSVTPRRSYQSQARNYQPQVHLGSDGKPLVPSGYNDSLYASNQQNGYGNQFYGNSNRSGGGYCRDTQVDISIEGLTDQPQRTQFYKFCKTESGWRQQ